MSPTPSSPTSPLRVARGVALSCVLGLLAFAVWSDEPKPKDPPTKKLEVQLDDPLPIQRVILPADKLAAELDRAKQGVYRQMSRQDFEERVQQAARTSQAAKEPPQLVEGIYRARFDIDPSGNENLTGSGEWKIIALSGRPSLLSIEPLSLALQQSRWPDNRYAVLGILDPKSSGAMQLLVESRGEKALYFDWSSRGVLEPGETRFDLQVPLAPIARLELNLPPNLTPFVTQSEVLLSGPVPQGEGVERRHLWTLAFGGQSRLELLLRKPPDPNRPAPLIRSRTTTTQTLASGKFLGKFDVNWEVFRGTVRDLNVLLDADLTPTEVVVNNLESWRVVKGPNSRKQLSIRLREPARGGRLEISTTAPLFTDEKSAWTSPGVELLGSLSRGEMLELRLAPELLFADWQPGNFQLANTKLETDRTQVFSLQSSFINEGVTLQRPQARIRTPGSDFRLQEQIDWYLMPELSTLTVQYQIEVTRGGLMQFPVRIPKEWELDLIETPIKELLPHATRQGSRLLFEFPKPVLSGSKFNFRVKFIQRHPPPKTVPQQEPELFFREPPKSVPFPEITPEGSPLRSGLFRVKVSPAYRANVTAPLTGEPPTHTEGVEPIWEIKFNGQPPAGTVHLRPRTASLLARLETKVTLIGNEATMVTRFHLKPESGLVRGLRVHTSGRIDPNCKWELVEGNNRIAEIRTTTPPPWSAHSGPEPRLPRGMADIQDPDFYTVVFAQPIDSAITLEWTYRPEGKNWSVAERRGQAIASLFAGRSALAPAILFRASESLTRTPSSPKIPLATMSLADVGLHSVVVRRFGMEPDLLEGYSLKGDFNANPSRLEATGQFPSLTLSAGKPQLAHAKIESIRLTTAINRTLTQRHHLDLRIEPRDDESLVLDFDNDVFVEAATIDGRTPSRLKWLPNSATGGNRLELPLPTGNAKQRVELVYHRLRGKSFFTQSIAASVPKFSVETPPIQYVWRLGPGFDPAIRESLKPLPGGEFSPSVYRLPGEFRDDLLHWLGRANPSESPLEDSSNLEWMLHARGLDWTAWDGDGTPSILVVRERAVFLLGGLLAFAVILVAGLRLKRLRFHNAIVLQVGFFILVVAAMMLPDSFRDLARGPLLALFVVAVFFVLARRKVPDEEKTIITRRKPPGSATGKLVATCLLLGCPALSAAPEVYPVYLLPDGKSVLVPPTLLEKLRELAEEPGSLSGCVVLRDDYSFSVNENLLEGKAKFLVHSFDDAATSLTLPLTGVRLREVLLDGAQAFPSGTGTDRFSLEVKGKGEHRIEINFTIPITGQGADRDVRLGIPETAHGKVEFTMRLDQIHELELLNWRGQQRTVVDGNRRTLTADLGRARSIHFRWRQEENKPRTLPRVSELYYWDLDPASATLFASLEYRFPQGSAKQLHVAVPRELEVTRLELRPLGTISNPPPAWIRDWRFAPDQPRNGFRHLVIDLQIPLIQPARLQLELIPVKPMSARPALTFPFALEVSDAEAFAAFRAQQLVLANDVERSGVVDFSSLSFFGDYWSKIGFGPNALPTKAARRTRDETMFLRPTFNLPSSSVTGSQELTWFLSDRRFEVRAEAIWKSPSPNLTFVEWELPTQVTLAEVRGDEIRAWSRSGSRVQVWLQRPCAEVKLHWTGSIARPDSVGERFVFDLPNIRLEGVAVHPTELTLKTLPGWSISRDQIRGLNSLPGQEAEPHYRAQQTQYGGRFWVVSPQVDGRYRSTQTVRIHDGILTLEAKIVPELRQNRRHEFTLDVRPFGVCETTLQKLSSKGSEKLTPLEKGYSSLTLLENESDFQGYLLSLTKPLPGLEYRLPAVKLLQGDLPMNHETDLIFESSDWKLPVPATRTQPWRITDEETILASKLPAPVNEIEPEPIPNLAPVASSRFTLFTLETLIRSAILLVCLMLLGVLTAFRGPVTRIEQIGLCGLLVGLGFDLPEALLGVLIGLFAILVRLGWLLRRFWRSVNARR